VSLNAHGKLALVGAIHELHLTRFAIRFHCMHPLLRTTMTLFAWIEAVILFAILVVAIACLHRIRKTYRFVAEMRDNLGPESHRPQALYYQIEALIGLYRLLDGREPLPHTRGWAAAPDFLTEIARTALERRPETIVECGSGASTIVLAYCAKRNGKGRVLSLEHEPVYAEATRSALRRHGLSDWATILDAPLTSHTIAGATWRWYDDSTIADLSGIDFLIVDGPPENTGRWARYPAGPRLFSRLSPGAVVMLDDALRPDELEILARWAREYGELVQTRLPLEKGAAVLARAPSGAH
jgi:predicted O-methyltransferase YrrM